MYTKEVLVNNKNYTIKQFNILEIGSVVNLLFKMANASDIKNILETHLEKDESELNSIEIALDFVPLLSKCLGSEYLNEFLKKTLNQVLKVNGADIGKVENTLYYEIDDCIKLSAEVIGYNFSPLSRTVMNLLEKYLPKTEEETKEVA